MTNGPDEPDDVFRRSEACLALMLEATPEGLWHWEAGSDVMFMSARARLLCGIDSGPATRSRDEWKRLIRVHPADRDRRRLEIERFLAGPAARLDSEWRVQDADGRVRWIRSVALCERDEQGQVTRIAGSMTDVDAAKSVQADLERARERFLLADSAGVGHTDWIVATDEFYGSPSYLAMCGLPQDTVFTGRADFVEKFPHHPEDRERVVKTFLDHYQGRTLKIEMDLRILVRGETRWLHLIGVCTRDAQGLLTRWTATLADITERIRAEAALRLSEERFDLAAAASTDGIWDWNVGEDAMFFSDRAQRICGMPPGPTVRPRQAWRTLVQIHPEDDVAVRRMADDYLAALIPAYDIEFRVRDMEGTYRWVRIRGLCLRDKQGRPTRFTGSVSDIDTAKRSEAALRQAQRLEAMGTLASGIAHDFNNVLAVVLGYGEMALRDAGPGTRLRRDVESVLTAGERGRALVDRILAFSSSGAAARDHVHVEAVVREALCLLDGICPPNVRIEAQLESGQAAVVGNQTQVHQVVMNLLTNAMHAMEGEGGCLTVRLETLRLDEVKSATTGTAEPGDYLLLLVCDTGCGIADGVLEKVFDPFFTTREVGVGTGLGLSLVHSIVSDVGGVVDLQSKVGVGTVVSIYLPRSGDAPAAAPGLDRPVPRGAGERILVVDDEEPLLRLSTETLVDLGYRATGFSLPLAAIQAFRAAPNDFDAIVTDHRMPRLTGAALLREARLLRPAIPALLVSGNPRAIPTDEAAEADATLAKPLSTADLARTLSRILHPS